MDYNQHVVSVRRTIYKQAALLGSQNEMALPYQSLEFATFIDTFGKTVRGTDKIEVESGQALSVAGTAIKWDAVSTGAVVRNYGLIESVAADGRAINGSGSTDGPRFFTLQNEVGGVIRSENDAFRINIDFSIGGIVVNNAGTIASTVSGQAIDFDALNSTAPGQIQIVNQATGMILSEAADAVRPGQNGSVSNYGLIYSKGSVDGSNDGVDFQSHAGTVSNFAGATISGQRHGITSDVYVLVNNEEGATIIGRNGSGIGSDGTAAIVNHGTIIGAWDGVSQNGDGDGIDIDTYGTVENYGVIRGDGASGVDKGGDRNLSEGIALTGGGTINNYVGGVIDGKYRAIFAYGGVSVSNSGLIEGVEQGVVLWQTEGNSLYNSGAIKSHGLAVMVQAAPKTAVFNDKDGSVEADNVGIYAVDAKIVNAGIVSGGNWGVGIGTSDLVNAATGIITGTEGIRIFDNSTVYNFGSISADTGIRSVSTVSAQIYNAGIINSSNDAIQLGDKDDSLTIGEGSHITGAVRGGGGNDTLILEEGSFFDSSVGFETLQVVGSSTILGTNVFQSVSIIDGAQLLLDKNSAVKIETGLIVVDGALIIRGSNSSFADYTIQGNGSVRFEDAESVILNNEIGWTGLTSISEDSIVLLKGNAKQFKGDVLVDGLVGIGQSTSLLANLFGSGSVVINDNMKLSLSGASAFGGQIILNDGSLTLEASSGVRAASIDFSSGDGTLFINSGSLAGGTIKGFEENDRVYLLNVDLSKTTIQTRSNFISIADSFGFQASFALSGASVQSFKLSLDENDRALLQAAEKNMDGVIAGTEKDDIIIGVGDSCIINGFAGNDKLYGGRGDDSINGGAGDDEISGGLGLNTIDGGAGIDIALLQANMAEYTITLTGENSAEFIRSDGLERHRFSNVEQYRFADGVILTLGSGGADTFDLSNKTGTVTLSTGAGNNAIYAGGALTSADRIDAGAGNNDQVALQGDYTGANALVLEAGTLTNVEVLAALAGGNYDITTDDGAVVAGQVFTVFAGGLNSGDSLTFNGSAEADGSFLFFGGAGTDTLTGGANNDAFFFGPDRFGASDTVVGGAGVDQIGFDSFASNLTLNARVDVEVVALLRGPNNTINTYGTILVDDSWVAAGETKTITAVTSFQDQVGPVLADLTIDGSGELNGNLRILAGSGNDTLNGGAGNDIIFGGLGHDTMMGGAGNDTFVFNAAVDSASTGFDTILDFDRASDTIQVKGQIYASFTDQSGGQLSQASFDTDLSLVLNTTLTGANGVFFTASSGDYAGQTFLIVNTDGIDGYQAGSDLVIRTDPGTPTPLPAVVAAEAFAGGSSGIVAPLDTAASLDHHQLIIV